MNVAAIIATLRYSLLSLRAHATRVGLTAAAVGVVSGVLCYLLSLTDCLHQALRHETDPRNVIVLAEASTAESNSGFPFDRMQLLKGIPGVARDGDGAALVSGELLAPLRIARRDAANQHVNVALRGVDLEPAQKVHTRVRLVAGRWFDAGADELVVGRAAQRRMAGTELGDEILVGAHRFRIVGVLEAGGGAHESEFWGRRANIGAALQRAGLSSATLRLGSDDPQTISDVQRQISAANIGLRPIRESDYFSNQTASGRLLEALAGGLALIMAVGAIFAAVNTMYAAVAGRTREIGVLRAIGFSRRRVLLGFLFESAMIGLLGGLAGCAICWAVLQMESGLRDLTGPNLFISVAFALRVTQRAFGLGLLAGILIGVLGGLAPAWAASRVMVVRALRAD